MNILFLTHHPQGHHGWARYTRELSHALNQLDHHTTIYDPQLSMYHPWINPLKFTKQLIKVTSLSHQFDLVHIVSEPYALFIPFLTKPTLLTAHGSFAINQLLRPFPFNYPYRHSYHQAHRITSVSKFTKNQLSSHLPITIIPNGINLQKFSPPKTTRQPLILSVGAVKKRKGYHISIPATIPFLKNHPQYKYLIVGSLSDHSYHHQLLTLIHQHQLSRQIKFLSQVPDQKLISFYRKARLFLLTPVSLKSKRHQKFEGFGQVFLEAQSCGCPVITSRSGGAPETIIPGKTGLLVPEGNIQATTQALQSFLSQPQKLKKMGKAAHTHAQNFSWNKIAQQYLQLYHQVLNPNSSLKNFDLSF